MSAQALPRSGPSWTVDDWWALNEASDGDRFELVDGGLFVTPPASWDHQWAGDELRGVLRRACPPGFRVATAVGVIIAGDSALIPDIVVRRDPPGPGTVPVEAVSLTIEIVSPSSRVMDRRSKPGIYAAAGIPHYWRLELLPFRDQNSDKLPVLFAYELDDGEYRPAQRAGAGTKMRFTSPFEVEFDPGELLDE